MMTALADELRQAMGALHDARGRLDSAYGRISGLLPLDPLPAPALTEQAIVDALKEDPAMAGRVMASVAGWYSPSDRSFVQGAAYNKVDALETPDGAQRQALQSLAAALAAASYRG